MIGLIFGETYFPTEILKRIKKLKLKYIIIDLTEKKKFKKDNSSYSLSIGQVGKIIKTLKLNKCKKVLFAGKVKRPSFSNIKLDLKGAYYIPRIVKSSKLGDAAILKVVIKILKKEKIGTVSSLAYNSYLTLKKGSYTKIKPDKVDQIDIKKAIETLDKLSKHNFSQGVVARNNKIIGVEGKGGTKKLLLKCRVNKIKRKGVLVKFPKKGQDLRIDLPTVGLKTFRQCRLAGLKGLVLKAKRNIFLDKKNCINFANKNRMFITVK